MELRPQQSFGQQRFNSQHEQLQQQLQEQEAQLRVPMLLQQPRFAPHQEEMMMGVPMQTVQSMQSQELPSQQQQQTTILPFKQVRSQSELPSVPTNQNIAGGSSGRRREQTQVLGAPMKVTFQGQQQQQDEEEDDDNWPVGGEMKSNPGVSPPQIQSFDGKELEGKETEDGKDHNFQRMVASKVKEDVAMHMKSFYENQAQRQNFEKQQNQANRIGGDDRNRALQHQFVHQLEIEVQHLRRQTKEQAREMKRLHRLNDGLTQDIKLIVEEERRMAAHAIREARKEADRQIALKVRDHRNVVSNLKQHIASIKSEHIRVQEKGQDLSAKQLEEEKRKGRVVQFIDQAMKIISSIDSDH